MLLALHRPDAGARHVLVMGTTGHTRGATPASPAARGSNGRSPVKGSLFHLNDPARNGGKNFSQGVGQAAQRVEIEQ
jgi:hypothetical protein